MLKESKFLPSVSWLLVGMPKFAFSHWFCWSFLQQCYATACTVILTLSAETKH